jgi:hypothetical protein
LYTAAFHRTYRELLITSLLLLPTTDTGGNVRPRHRRSIFAWAVRGDCRSHDIGNCNAGLLVGGEGR